MDRIPPESLTSIFDFTCRPDGRSKGTGFLATNPTGYGKDIVTLTHVCRYWRATILSNPKFWTIANLTHGFMTSALLKRSRSMPIVATYITHNPNATVPSTKRLLPHFPRIQKVHIDAASLEQLMDFLSILSGHSSILEAVELQSSIADNRDIDDEDEEDEEVWRWSFGLPEMLKDASSLTFFRVSNLPFSDCFLELHHLTHLELSCTGVWCSKYLAVMAANPMLEAVILRGTEDCEEEMHDPETIHVPHLRRLELYDLPVEQILGTLSLPLGIHVCIEGHPIRDSDDDLPIVSTAEKLQFMFSERLGTVSRVASGSSPNGTFSLCEDFHRLNLDISEIPLGSLKQLSISFTDTGAGEGSPSLTFADIRRYTLESKFFPFVDIHGHLLRPAFSPFVDIHGHILESTFSPFARLQALILQRVRGCEAILRLLCDPHICPRLNTVVLVNVQSHATYWPSLVELAHVRGHHSGSSNVVRVEIGCRAEEPPEPDQLAELRAHVFSVEIKPWDYEVEDLDWLNDSRFNNLGRL